MREESGGDGKVDVFGRMDQQDSRPMEKERLT
jgi:hypothetical protein